MNNSRRYLTVQCNCCDRWYQKRSDTVKVLNTCKQCSSLYSRRKNPLYRMEELVFVKCPLCNAEYQCQGRNADKGKPCRPCTTRKNRQTHGMSNSKLYYIYKGMRNRCYNPSVNGYNNYGGRGIEVCDEWLSSFAVFAEWAIANGYKEGLSIDRIDVDGRYSPDNCRWVTKQDQQMNKRVRLNAHSQKLTPADVVQIKMLLAQGVPCKKIAEQFDIRIHSIYDIKNGKRWTSISPDTLSKFG